MDEAVLGLTAQVISGYISNNRLSGGQLPELIRAVYKSLSTAGAAAAAAAAKVEPAADVKKSVFADHLPRLRRVLQHAEAPPAHRTSAHADRIPRAIRVGP
jgi:predicted transcriptional regulator